MDAEPPRLPLEYAPASPAAGGRRIARRVGVIGLIAGAIVLAVGWGPDVFRQVWYLRAQGRCMEFQLPADQLVYANRPEEAAGLLAGGFKQVASVTSGAIGNAPGATMSAGAALPPLAGVGEDTMASYASAYSGYGGYLRQPVTNAPIRTGAFLHARRTPAGLERLVAVVFLEKDGNPGEGRRLEVNGLVWRPADWEPGSRLQLLGLSTLVLPHLDSHTVRIYAGKADPADSSRFTLTYDVDGVAGTVDGWVDDYSQAHFQVRDGPASATAYSQVRR